MEPHRRFDASVYLLQFLFVIVTGRFTLMYDSVHTVCLRQTQPKLKERKLSWKQILLLNPPLKVKTG